MTRRRVALAVLIGLLVGAVDLHAQTFTAQIQQFWNLLRTGSLKFQTLNATTLNVTTLNFTSVSGSGPVTFSGTQTTTANPFSVIYTGTTNPSNYFTNALFGSNVTLANGLAFATGVNNYYLYAPTDSDASGSSRIATLSYLETRGTQNLSSFLYSLKARVIHLGTGSVGTLQGVEMSSFNGHSGEQATTGGNITTMYGLKVGLFGQSTNSTIGTQFGIQSVVENDNGAGITTAYGIRSEFAGAVLPATSYGFYAGTILGSSKFSFFSSDATAPSSFAGSVGSPTFNYTTKINGTGFVFANIGTVLTANGDMAYCSDCTLANPCASGGSGALAKRLNGVNVCN